jgi:hypothetical protein
MLKQLGLKFFVQADGLVVITGDSDEIDAHGDLSSKVLNEITSLRLEVRRLQQSVTAGR